jgi:shikimate kinase
MLNYFKTAPEALKAIFEKHKNERICVVGTMCCGKTTLIKQLAGYNCIDMDDEFWPQASEAEIAYYSQRPFTKELNDSLYKLFCERIAATPGFPLFGVYILDCEVAVYLDISNELLNEHCKKRGDTDFTDAYNLKKWLEDDWNNQKAKNRKVLYSLTIQE